MNQRHSSTRGDSEGLWDWNLVSNRIHYSPRWIALVGCEDHEVGNSPDEWLQRVHPEDIAEVSRELDAARGDGPRELEFRHRLRHTDGTYRWMLCRGEVVRNEGGKGIRLMGSHSDVTADTVTDKLTGLPNRLLLVDRLARSIERAQRYEGFHFAVLLLDLGRPASHTGHAGAIADPLLTAAARRLETCLRIGDTTAGLRQNDLVARLQGDQFTILLDGLKDVSRSVDVGDRILGEILAPFTLNGREVFLAASIGVAVSATGYTRAEDVLRDAETALHRAQVLGGSHCEVFDTAVLRSEQAELRLEGDLADGLERQEFQVFYQPVVSIESNQIVGFEALVRWQHPVLGMIPPLDFIPIAERTGFIVPLGNWILREACARLKSWQGSLSPAADPWVAVNLSGVQLKHPGLVEEVADALRDTGLEPGRLVLELTEGIAMENPTAVKTLLMHLRAMGVRISIDDFGTGYSSLAYLRQFPLDALKVDRTFVRGMEIDKDTADIVGALIAMAQQLGLHVVAEGIENEAQLSVLRSLRCTSAQGYLFAKPLAASKAAELLRTGLPSREEIAADSELAPVPRLGWHTLDPRHGHSPTRRRLFIAAAALALMASASLVSRLTSARRAVVVSSASDVPLFPLSVTPAPADVVAAGGTASGASNLAAAGPAAPRTAVPLAAAPAAPVAADAAASRIVRPGVARQTSFEVVHLHRVGSCEGRLVVSREGVAFVPDGKASSDAFTFKKSEFLYTLADNRLTIKSNDRTYRFKAAVADGKNDDGSQLRDVADGLARFR